MRKRPVPRATGRPVIVRRPSVWHSRGRESITRESVEADLKAFEQIAEAGTPPTAVPVFQVGNLLW